MSDYITAAEATTILRDLARGREDGDGGDVWPLYDRAEDAMRQVIALDLAATLLESERAAERTRAEAAEAEVARLTTELDAARRAATFAETERDAARRAATLAETERDAARRAATLAETERDTLRAIVESVRSARAVSAAAAARYTAAWDAVGTMPPTPAQSEEIAAALRAAYEAGDALIAALDAAREGR